MPTPLSAIRRWHKWWFWPIHVGALLVFAAWYWYVNHSPMGRLRASGAPMTFEELVPEPIPDEQSIAAGLRDLEPRIAKIPNDLYEFGADYGDLADPAECLDEAQEWLRPQADLIEELLKVAQRPRYASLMPPAVMADPQGMLDYPQKIRSVARLLTLQVRAHVGSGRVDQAVETTTAALQFAKAWEGEPFILGKLIASATQTMALRDASFLADRDDLTTEQAESLLRVVQKLEDRSSARNTLISERVLSLAKLRELSVVGLLSQSSILRLYEEALAITETPIEGWAQAGTEASHRANGMLAQHIAPAVQSWFESEARVAGEARAVREKLEERLAN